MVPATHILTINGGFSLSKSRLVFSLLIAISAIDLAAQQPYWVECDQNGQLPTIIWDGAMAMADKNDHVAYRFGGQIDVFPLDFTIDEFYAYDLDTGIWTQLATAPMAAADPMMISGPCAHCVTVVGGRGRFRTGADLMYPQMFKFQTKAGKWREEDPGDETAIRRSSATIVEVPAGPALAQRRYYLFGGVGNTLPSFPTTPTGLRNDVAVYDHVNGWRDLETFGEPPAPRSWHLAVYHPAAHGILIFGGYRLGPDQGPDTPPFELFGPTNFENDLWFLDLTTRVWTRLEPVNEGPSTRDNARGFVDEARNLLVVFGGQRHDGVLNDLWTYSFTANEWQEMVLPAVEPAPQGRVGSASFVRETDDAYELYIHGGATGDGTGVLLNDMWKLIWPKL